MKLKNFRFIVMTMFLMSVFVANVDAKIIYVDILNTSGVEDGSAQYPFNTIQEGVNIAIGGDVVSINKGEYAENITVDRSITIQPRSSNDVVVIRPIIPSEPTVTLNTTNANLRA